MEELNAFWYPFWLWTHTGDNVKFSGNWEIFPSWLNSEKNSFQAELIFSVLKEKLGKAVSAPLWLNPLKKLLPTEEIWSVLKEFSGSDVSFPLWLNWEKNHEPIECKEEESLKEFLVNWRSCPHALKLLKKSSPIVVIFSVLNEPSGSDIKSQFLLNHSKKWELLLINAGEREKDPSGRCFNFHPSLK